jgi:hypothetical protein
MLCGGGMITRKANTAKAVRKNIGLNPGLFAQTLPVSGTA